MARDNRDVKIAKLREALEEIDWLTSDLRATANECSINKIAREALSVTAE